MICRRWPRYPFHPHVLSRSRRDLYRPLGKSGGQGTGELPDVPHRALRSARRAASRSGWRRRLCQRLRFRPHPLAHQTRWLHHHRLRRPLQTRVLHVGNQARGQREAGGSVATRPRRRGTPARQDRSRRPRHPAMGPRPRTRLQSGPPLHPRPAYRRGASAVPDRLRRRLRP